ncbi:DUF6498-containing protein [Brevundimonas staleyi]|uniref:DUF6498-containing protein n=1 Tax=Brevundimonas staleyi TaxID=74326 RepID=A0ABW0FTP9_9CAUL
MTVNEILAHLKTRPLAVAGVVAANLIPVFGVIFLGWDAVQILILYWAENVLLGLLTIPRLLVASRDKPGAALFLAGFFTVHYGLFCLAHLFFAMLLISDVVDQGGTMIGAFLAIVRQASFQWAVVALAVLNLATQIREWWWPGKWRGADPKTEMFKPYGRIFVLHLTVLIGAGLVLSLGGPAGAVLILCLMKAALELGLVAFGSVPRTDAEPA